MTSLPESVLLQVYTEELHWYAKALSLARQLPAHDQVQAEPPCLHELVEVMKEIARLEEPITETRNHWLKANHNPGPRLQQVLLEIGNHIREIQQCLSKVEQNLVHQQTVLEPELDKLARCKQLQRAYLDFSD